ncbi:MAG: hypothetical protein RSI32_10090 [Clostridia bacterium]
MKKVLCFVIAGMIASCSTVCYAASRFYSISELNLSGIPRWTQSYETKWRTVEVDVQPTLPKVACMPIGTVEFDPWLPDITLFGEAWYAESYASIFNVGKGEPPKDAEAFAKDVKPRKCISVDLTAALNTDEQYLPGNALTLDEAQAQFAQLVSKVGFGMRESRVESIEAVYWVDAQNVPIPMSGYYSFTMQELLHGIPILAHARNGVEKYAEEVPSTATNMMYRILSEDSIDFVGLLVKEKTPIAQDVPLCDFSVIKETLEQEIIEGRLRRVFDVELGYVLYNRPGITIQPGSEWMETCEYYAVPAWRINCWYVGNPKKEIRDYTGKEVPQRGIIEYGALIINAQTGILLDRNSTDQRTGDYDKLIP